MWLLEDSRGGGHQGLGQGAALGHGAGTRGAGVAVLDLASSERWFGFLLLGFFNYSFFLQKLVQFIPSTLGCGCCPCPSPIIPCLPVFLSLLGNFLLFLFLFFSLRWPLGDQVPSAGVVLLTFVAPLGIDLGEWTVREKSLSKEYGEDLCSGHKVLG